MSGFTSLEEYLKTLPEEQQRQLKNKADSYIREYDKVCNFVKNLNLEINTLTNYIRDNNVRIKINYNAEKNIFEVNK